jgi:hypothetical protein
MIHYLPKYLVIALLMIGATSVCIESSTARSQSPTEESAEKSVEENVLIMNVQRFVRHKPVSKAIAHLAALNISNASALFCLQVIHTRLYIRFRSILI